MRKLSSRRSTKEPLASGNSSEKTWVQHGASALLMFNYHDNFDVSSQKGLSKQVGAQRAWSGFALVSEPDSPLEKTPVHPRSTAPGGLGGSTERRGRREAWPHC